MSAEKEGLVHEWSSAGALTLSVPAPMAVGAVNARVVQLVVEADLGRVDHAVVEVDAETLHGALERDEDRLGDPRLQLRARRRVQLEHVVPHRGHLPRRMVAHLSAGNALRDHQRAAQAHSAAVTNASLAEV